jgi:predicted aldo/keto reductase-like oxidoreductase
MVPQRELGKTGMMVYPVGLGCMGYSHASGDPMPEKEAVRHIEAAYDMGITFSIQRSATQDGIRTERFPTTNCW